MSIFRKLRELVWPLLEKSEATPYKALKESDIIVDENHLGKTLEFAIKDYQAEEDRNKGVETKSSLFVGTISVVTSIVIAIATVLIQNTEFTLQLGILVSFLFVLTIYMARTIWFSIQALERKSYHSFDEDEYLISDSGSGYYKKLIVRIVNITRQNSKTIDSKVSSMTMAQEYFKRAIAIVSLYAFIIFFIFLFTIKGVPEVALSNETISNHKPDSAKMFDNISDDTIFTVLVTISIFVFGIIVDRAIKAIDKWIDKRNLRRFYRFNINMMYEKLFPKISTLYRSFYLNHGIDSGIPMTPPKVLSQDAERLSRLEFNKVYDAFRDKVKLAKVMASLDFISKAIHEVESYHSHIYSVSQEMRVNFQNILTRYTAMLAEYLIYERTHNPGYSTDSTYLFINNSLLTFHKEIAGKRALRKLFKEIIRPVQRRLVEETRKFEDHEVGKELAKLGRDLSHKYNEIKTISLEIRLQYRYFYFQLDKSIKDVENDRKHLK